MQPPTADTPPAEEAGGLLQLVFSGESLPGFDRPTVRLTIERTLQLDAAHSAHLFSGQRVVVRQGLAPAEAARYVERFARMGARLRMEPDTGPRDAPARMIGLPPPAPARNRRRSSSRRRRRGMGPVLAAGALLVLGLLGAAVGLSRLPAKTARPAPPELRPVTTEAAPPAAGSAPAVAIQR